MTISYREDNQSWFSDWLSRAWPRVHQIIFYEKWVDLLPVIQALGVLGAIFTFVTALVTAQHPEKYLFYVNDIGHIVLLLIAYFFFLPRLGVGRSLSRREEGDIVSRAIIRFQNWLYILVILWLLFYICRAIFDGAVVFYSTDTHSGANFALAKYAYYASPYFNTISAFAFFGLYLSAEYVGTSGWAVGGRIWPLVGIVLLGATLQLIAHSLGPYPPPKGEPPNELALLAGILNGLIVGISIVLLIGRLDSRYIGLHKGVITALYFYSLIQPLYPYIFQKPAEDNLGKSMQYILVAIALLMKSVLLVSIGKIIDVGTLHFYISSMRWLDRHAVTLRAQYESSRNSGRLSHGGPCLFSLVPPNLNKSATVRIEQLDVQVQLDILNAWIGVGWDIKQLSAKRVKISDTELPIKIVKWADAGSLRVAENNKYARTTLIIDFTVTTSELRQKLKKDPHISQAIAQGHKTKRVDVVLYGLEAYASIVDDREMHYIWHPVESVDSRDALFYSASLHMDDLNDKSKKT